MRASCHPKRILGLDANKGSYLQVRWQARGQAPGFGWEAFVTETHWGYSVANCEEISVVHG